MWVVTFVLLCVITPTSCASLDSCADNSDCMTISKEGESLFSVCEDDNILACEPELDLCEASKFGILAASHSTGCDVRCLNLTFITEGVASLENICDTSGSTCAENSICDATGQCQFQPDCTAVSSSDFTVTGEFNILASAPTGTVSSDPRLAANVINIWIEDNTDVVASSLEVDLDTPGSYGPSTGVDTALENQIITGAAIPDGDTIAYSVFLYHTTTPPSTATITFPTSVEIIGLILSHRGAEDGLDNLPNRLDATDVIFASAGSTFPGGNRGTEPQIGPPPGDASTDYIVWTANPATGDTLEVSMKFPDNLRVLLACRE
eukprot:TRINITY_DN6701_c0_g1_i1.p1 TRINITY_DN6701_c0_g1~~TRINITY_DN6701_c0_g1_i1.p1  ORF type:complete len:322 (-),score=30.16 TRINITY_DN6701_c0_g1_i1:84-1049(-)